MISGRGILVAIKKREYYLKTRGAMPCGHSAAEYRHGVGDLAGLPIEFKKAA